MCSVDPDGLIEMTRATKALDISGGDVMCRKCEEAVAVVVLRVKDAYCSKCFLAYFVHKFRSTIGKSKQIQPGDHVLVAFSGGPSSTAMMHLISEGLAENSHKKLRFVPAFLYIDESVLQEFSEGSGEHTSKVIEQVLSLGFPCYVTALEQVMALQMPPPVLVQQVWEDTEYSANEDLRIKLCQLFASCKSTSSRLDLHDQLLQTLMKQCATSLGFKKLFSGENSTTLSIRILSQVAIGRGSQLANRVQFKTVFMNTEIYRPMREILENEILHYLYLRNISAIKSPGFECKGTTISSCTEDFVRGLQKEFPATIPTIFRTGDKLMHMQPEDDRPCSPSSGGNTSSDLCVLCGSDLDTRKGEASALNATVISQKFSCKTSSGITQQGEGQVEDKVSVDKAVKDGDDGVSPDCDGSCGPGWCGGAGSCSTRDLHQVLMKTLCYGCRIILRDLGEVKLLPASVHAMAAEKEQRRVMKEQIKDFLL